jgi:hypothetical protein
MNRGMASSGVLALAELLLRIRTPRRGGRWLGPPVVFAENGGRNGTLFLTFTAPSGRSKSGHLALLSTTEFRSQKPTSTTAIVIGPEISLSSRTQPYDLGYDCHEENPG